MKFRNLEPPYEPNSMRDVLKWALADKVMGRRREAPKRVRVPQVAPDLPLLSSAAGSLTWVGHASWIARLDGVTLYLDPVWSDALGPGLSRNVAPGLALEEAPPPDAVLVSHNHRDHLDEPTIRRIAAITAARGVPRPTWICGEGLGGFFRKRDLGPVVELPWWGEHVVRGASGGEVRVAFVPSQHWSQRGPLDRNETLWGGFVLTGAANTGSGSGSGGTHRVYHSGDTAWFGGFAEIGRRYPKIDAAMLPIGAYDPEWFMRRQHMNPEDAVRAFEALGARLFCAMHWGTFKLTDEPLDEPPQVLEDERKKRGLATEQVWLAAIGESRAL